MDTARQTTSASILGELGETVLAQLGTDVTGLRVKRAVVGIFFTAIELDNGCGGLCATPARSAGCSAAATAPPAAGRISGRTVAEMLVGLEHSRGLPRALAIATLNALTETLWRRDGPPAGTAVTDGDALAALSISPQQQVVLVGAFPPYLRELRQRRQPFKVLELDPATLGAEDLPFYVPAAQAAQILPAAELMIVTGTTLLNDTLDELLQWMTPGSRSVIVGPSTILAATPYRRRGVVLVGGTRIIEPTTALDLLAEGASARDLLRGNSVRRINLHIGP